MEDEIAFGRLKSRAVCLQVSAQRASTANYHVDWLSQGNKYHFGQIFVEVVKEFLIVIIQSWNSMSTRDYSENYHASIAQQVMLHCTQQLWNENRRLSPISEVGFRHELELVHPTALLRTVFLGGKYMQTN